MENNFEISFRQRVGFAMAMKTTLKKNIPRSASFFVLLLAAAGLLSPPVGRAASGGVLVGAIRWDAWQEGGGIQKAVEKTLSPAHWHYRLPFFAQVTGSNTVIMKGGMQAIMDQEINYAADAGIDYWAFCIYDDSTGMSRGLHLYLQSPLKHRINFALNLQGKQIARNYRKWNTEVTRYVNYFKDPAYQKVLGNRPLVFLFNPVTDTSGFTKDADVAAAFQQLRTATIQAGLGNPYIVYQGWNPKSDLKTMRSYGLDATGAYAVAASAPGNMPYASLAAKARRFWETGKATKANIVPIVTAGWDNRTRVETPVPWTPGSKLNALPPSPAELANHLAEAVDWTSRNRNTVTPAQTVLIYAWNENDEGGWLVPTLKPDGSANTDRLDAIAAKLKNRNNK